MADKDLSINLKLDKTAADQASKEFFAAQKERQKQDLADLEVIEKAKTQFQRRELRQRIDDLAKSIKTSSELIKESAREEERINRELTREKAARLREQARAEAESSRLNSAAREAAIEQQQRFTRAVANGVTALAGLAVGRRFISSIAEGAQEATQKIARMAEEFIRLRDRGRELAGVMGTKSTSAFTREQLEFAKETALEPDKAIAFREAFRGGTEQYVDRFAPGEFEKLEVQMGQFASMNNISPAAAGELAGNVVGMGPKRGATAAGVMTDIYQSFRTMQEGKGTNEELAGQLSETLASMGGTVFKRAQDAAVAVRTQAQARPQEAFTMIQNVRRGQLELDDKEQRALGVTSSTPYFEFIERVKARADASGKPLDDALREMGFRDIRVVRGLSIAINQGIDNNIVSKGMADASRAKYGDFQSSINDYLTDPDQGQLRREQAGRMIAEADASKNRVAIAPLLERARAEVTPLTTNSGISSLIAAGDWLMPAGWKRWWGGFENKDDVLTYTKAMRIAENEAAQAGVKFTPRSGMDWSGTPNAIAMGRSKVEEYLAGILKLTQEAKAETEKQTKAIEAQNRPAPLPQGPPANLRARP